MNDKLGVAGRLKTILTRASVGQRGVASTGYEVFLSQAARDINDARLRHLASLELELRGRRVLEVGAGIGLHTEFFERLECRVLSTDGRKENIRELRRRYPRRDARVLDLDGQEGFDAIGQFDVIYCYGTLYHLQRPEEAIRRLASLCTELLLLETMVTPATGSSIEFVSEDAATLNQGMAGKGCRPTRRWVLEQLRTAFGYAYITKTQPLHPEFPLDWSRPVPGKNHRAVFVASKMPLENHRLSETLVPCQVYDVDHAKEVWLDVGAHLSELSVQETRGAPWRTVYAFEPNIRLAARLFARVPNYVVVPMAVSAKDGFAEFYLNVADAWSSLHPSRPVGLHTWVGNEGLRIETNAPVPTIRLDTFLHFMEIASVQKLNVDAPGADYDVIVSLGARLRDVERVEMNVAKTPEQLYEAAHTEEEIIAFLTREGFRLAGQERPSSEQEEHLRFERCDEDSGKAKTDFSAQA